MAEQTVRRCRPLLGTFVEIGAVTDDPAIVDAAFAAIAHVHARMSFHDEESDLAALRRAAVGEPVRVDPVTVAVLRQAAMLNERSEGLFDVTIGRRLVATGYLPRPPGCDLRRMTGTGADIEILDDDRVRCHRPVLIDLGGIAKGYAVDRAIAVLRGSDVAHATVNAGGDLRVIGTATVDLRGADGTVDGAIEVRDAAIASSSNRHLRRRHRGRTASPHLGADRIGVLADEAVTVVAAECLIADAMTKIALADLRLAAAMLDELGGAIVPRPALAMAA